jgi:GNAT superfamily N-acetyltransferase
MGEVSVRPARLPEDLAQICALYAEEVSWHHEHWPGDYRAPDMGGGSLEAELSSSADDPGRCLLVAESDSHLRPKPAEGMTRYDGSLVYIGDLIVTADYRRRGVGARLMEQLEKWARDQGAATVTLNVHDRNSAARALYDRQGFRAVHVEMRKDLTA